MTFEEKIQAAISYFKVKPTLKYEIDNVATIVAERADEIDDIRIELKKRINYKEVKR
jgi:hypothetical protein